jgi:hypothetical protein
MPAAKISSVGEDINAMCCEVLVTKFGIWQAEDEKVLFHEMSQIKSPK